MAVKLLRLWDPTTQFQLKGGQLNVAGRLYVHYADTDDLADLYDDDGTQLSQPVILDNNGRAAGLFVDADRVYWLDVQDMYGMSQFTIRKMTPCGGGGGSLLGNTYNVTSSDGSIAVDKSTEGNTVTYDLSLSEHSNELVEWIRCDGATKAPNTDIYTPFYTSGTMRVATRGIQLYSDRYYHVTVHVSANKPSNASPWYDDIDVKFVLDYGGGAESVVVQKSCIVDYSISQSQDYEISADVHPTSNAELLIEISGGETGNTFNLSDVEIHRVYSGVPYIPQEWLERLQSDWSEQDVSKVTYIQHKPDLSVYATNAALEAGLATKQDTISDLQTIRDGAALGATAVQDANYVHTDNNFTTAEKNKLSGIAAGAEVNVQSDWSTTDTNADSFIKNKPANLVQDASYVHTDNNFTTTLKNKLDGIASGAEVNVQSDWSTTDTNADSFIKNKPNLATVATSGSYNDLSNKPTIPAAQVNSNWNATTGVAAILNKPTLGSLASKNAVTDSDISGTISDTHIASASTWNAKQNALPTTGTATQTFSININGSAASATSGASGTNIESYFTANTQNINDINTALNNKQPLCNMYIDGTNASSGTAYTDTVNARAKGYAPVLNVGGIYLPLTYVSLDPNDSSVMWYHFEDNVTSTNTAYHRIVKPSSITNSDTTGVAHFVSYDANQGLSTANQLNARKNINALTRAQFTDFFNTLTLERTGRTFLDNNVVWAGNSPRHTWKSLWSIAVPAHCYMLWSIGGQLRVQESSQTEWAISLNEDSNSYPTSELYSTYFMSNGASNLSTNLPGIWHFYSSGLNQHTVYIGMYNSSEAVPSTGASLYGKIYAPAGDGQRKTGPWFTYFIMEAANIKADE